MMHIFHVALVCQKLRVLKCRHFYQLDLLNVNIFIQCIIWDQHLVFLFSVMNFSFYVPVNLA